MAARTVAYEKAWNKWFDYTYADVLDPNYSGPERMRLADFYVRVT